MPSSSALQRGLLAASVALALACASAFGQPVTDPTREIERLYRGGEVAMAFQQLDQALQRQPDNARLRFLRGVMLTEARREAEALAVFEQLTHDFPDLPEPYNNLAALHAARGQIDRARELLEQAVRHDPRYFAALENLGDVYIRLAQRAYDKAGADPRADANLQRKLRLTREFLPR